MAYVFGVPVLLFLLALAYGGITGRVRLTSCCAVADPRRDLRMRAAFPQHVPGEVIDRADAADRA
jgi:hypothetical protein